MKIHCVKVLIMKNKKKRRKSTQKKDVPDKSAFWKFIFDVQGCVCTTEPVVLQANVLNVCV